jgi:4-diphosphocytidyl-2-C-methyl-D-erythritol kinase
MVFFPHCKINLGLNVLRKREDGYHDLATCFYPVPLTDILEVIPSTDFSFSKSGIDIPGDDQENLCIKAFQLVSRHHRVGNVRIHLHKSIPMGAGLGGGSSDGAFTLRALNEIFALNLSAIQLSEFALQLGSDCAFFLQDKPQVGYGRGNELTPIAVELKGKFLVLVKPPIHVSTAEAYRGVVPARPLRQLERSLSEPVGLWNENLRNDFEQSVLKNHPEISAIKTKLRDAGALYAAMSGSGSAVFGIFSQAVNLRNEFPQDHFYWSSKLIQ